MAEQDHKASTPPEKVKADAKGAMAPSQANPNSDGALAIGDATPPPHNHSSSAQPKTSSENAGEER